MRQLIIVISTLIICWSCTKSETLDSERQIQLNYPPGFPTMDFPEDNQLTQARLELGRKLFFEPLLSDDNELSCGSCHHPELAFADNRALSPGSQGAPGTRNAPSLANIGYHPYFTREGGIPTLEMQILVPIQEHNEFNSNIVSIAEELKQVNSYSEMAWKAYGQEMNPFVITRALASFERTLISGGSTYDLFLNGFITGMDASALRGMELFFSDRSQCSSCHKGFNFTNYEILNNGLYKQYEDPGLFRLTGIDADSGKFKVPSLRNIALTGPYMHDGSLNSLMEVINHYDAGGSGHSNQDVRIQPLGLNSQEKIDLIQFLEALTDYAFIKDDQFQNH